VFITLGYLAIQVRHAKEEVQRTVGKMSVDSAQEILLAQVMHPSIAAIYVKANANLGLSPPNVVRLFMERAGLTEEEANVLNSPPMAWWQHRVQVIPYLETMLPSWRLLFEKATRSYLARPAMQMWYDEFKVGQSHPDGSQQTTLSRSAQEGVPIDRRGNSNVSGLGGRYQQALGGRPLTRPRT
jgi:hypothetical protein